MVVMQATIDANMITSACSLTAVVVVVDEDNLVVLHCTNLITSIRINNYFT